MPVPGLSPMSKARCLQRSSFPSAAGFFLLTQANRSDPCGSCIQFWAIAIVEKADKAIAAAIDFIALIFTSLFGLHSPISANGASPTPRSPGAAYHRCSR